MTRAPVEQGGVRSARGPLVVVRGTRDVGWDEEVLVRPASGELRHGVVLEVDRDLAVVQVHEGTAGIDPDRCRVAFTGHPFEIPVTERWLGRECNGRGDPIDGGPPVLAADRREVTGAVVNPARRETPSEPIITGVSAIDALMTLVRGQKLPIFSIGGLPHLELAVQIAAGARAGDEPFRVIFAAMGITRADLDLLRTGLQERADAGELTLIANTAADPVVERLLTPRVALTIAEHLAFDRGFHVLVVLADMTNYCEALREVAAARGEIPTRGGFPGYLYTDLASLYERCGRLDGRSGSITQVPVLTMPGGDITHPVPDLTGYITEGQIVLSQEIWARGVFPPVDVLASLSRLMRLGTGEGRTRDDHAAVSAQLYASLAQARRARELAELMGASALSGTDRYFLGFADAFEQRLLSQPGGSARTIDQTLDLAWEVLSRLPQRELTMVSEQEAAAHYRPAGRESGEAAGSATTGATLVGSPPATSAPPGEGD